MCGNSKHGNRETSPTPSHDGDEGRLEKASGRTSNMYGSEESDGLIVPRKRANKNAGASGGAIASAELVEGSGSTKGNALQPDTCRAQNRESVPSGLERVRQVARREKDVQFTTLLHHVDIDRLRSAYYSLNRRASAGVDGETWAAYGQNLEERLRDLHGRIHRGGYRALPSRRQWIPKASGGERPLGIASMEDKIVQAAVREVLEVIYEVDFKGFSYGFRPGRGPHDALDALWVGLTKRKVNWVLDADIQGFFDAISHEWMTKFLEHRIADRRVLRLIRKWLKAGVLEGDQWTSTESGTPQGAVISPLLANVYLHYVFDLWVHQWRSRKARGDVTVVRYADDFVLGFQDRGDAERCLAELRERLRKFGLSLHPEKTRLLEFGRFAAERRRRRGEGKPETFEFLGFVHACSQDRHGRFTIRRVSSAKRMRRKLQEVKNRLTRDMHRPLPEQGQWLRAVVRGWFGYHAVPGNYRRLDQFRTAVTRTWHSVLRRRSHKARKKLNWSRMKRHANRWLIRPKILHPYPDKRFAATHPR